MKLCDSVAQEPEHFSPINSRPVLNDVTKIIVNTVSDAQSKWKACCLLRLCAFCPICQNSRELLVVQCASAFAPHAGCTCPSSERAQHLLPLLRFGPDRGLYLVNVPDAAHKNRNLSSVYSFSVSHTTA